LPPTSDSEINLNTPAGWQSAVESTGLASLLVLINARMGDLAKHVVAEDVLQDSLLNAWRARANVQWLGRKAFRSWLLTIIDRCISDTRARLHAAKRGAGNVALFRSLEHGMLHFDPAGTTTPSRAATLREQAAVMRQSLDELPDDLRDVVRLRLFEQHTVRAIAESLGLSVSTVEHRVRRGVTLYHGRLRAILAQSTIDTRKPRSDAVSSGR
jgi:RNA polymerase sigma factor (sigma-70 family)